MSALVQYAPYALRRGTWETDREKLGERVTAILEEHMPGLERLILHRQVLTPVDLEARFGLTEGHIYHGEMTLDQLLVLRPVPGWSRYRTPVEGLYLCGSGSHPGGGITGAPGYNAPREVPLDFRSGGGPRQTHHAGLQRVGVPRRGQARDLHHRPGRDHLVRLPNRRPEEPQPRSPTNPFRGAATMIASKVKLPNVVIPRNIRLHYERFLDHFKGFETVDAVRGIFGPRTKSVLRALKVEFFSSKWGYMGVSDEDGHLVVSTHYLRTGKQRDIYLDVVHELVHVRQFREGKELFPDGFNYPDAPTEIEAYKVCIAEGRRLGMTDRDLFKYLKVEWMDPGELRRLARNVGGKAPPNPRGRRKREASLPNRLSPAMARSPA